MAVRLFKYGSLVLAVVGLAVLLYAAIRSETPTVRIGDLQATMNWAYVRVEGVVTGQPTYDAKTGTLRLWVDDGTGEIMISAYSAEAEELLEHGPLPVMGDRVALEGTLRIKEDFQYLVLNVPAHTEIQAVEPLEMDIADVSAAPLYEKVMVRGMVREVRTPYEGLVIYSVRDGSGEIDVTLASGGVWADLGIGQVVEVVGAVDSYNGTPQISVGRSSDLAVLDEAVVIAPSRKMGEIRAAGVGSMASVEGTIQEVIPFSAGVKYRLDDGSGSLTLLLWQDLYDQMVERESLIEGTAVRAVGDIMEYRGELEIVPQAPVDVEIMSSGAGLSPSGAGLAPSGAGLAQVTPMPTGGSPSATPLDVRTEVPTKTATDVIEVTVPTSTGTATPSATPAPPPTPAPQPTKAPPPTSVPTLPPETRMIGSISAEDVGRRFTIAEAGIADVTYFSSGIKYTLTDGTGSIVLLLWQNVLEEVPGRLDLYPGSQVRIVGDVDEYGGDLEIIPEEGTDVAVLAAGDRPPVEVRAVGDVTPSDEGRLFTVQGTVSRVEDHGWLYVWIQDGTGEILVYVPERVVEFLPAGIGPGVGLRVSGEVDIYKGVIEIIPQAGADVEAR